MKILKQCLLLFGILAMCKWIAPLLPLPIPSTVLAMLVLLLLLGFKIIRPEQLQDTASFLVQHITLFLIPAALAFVAQLDTLASVWLPLVLIAIVSGVVIMVVTGGVIQFLLRRDADV